MYTRFLKRFCDLIISIMALPFWFVLFIVIAPVIYLQDRGPVFYNAKRLGKDGKEFTMFKFRTMKTNAPDLRNEDGSTYNSKDDNRLTSIGKFIRATSIDETPQILNVINGTMSIIGPRPDLPEHKQLYVGEEVRKLEVRPGITGYSQAYFRNSIPWKERIQNDIYYIDHLTMWLDIKVFIKTVISVFGSKDIYVDK